MKGSQTETSMQTLEIVRELEIAAPIDVVFETILEQMGPLNETPDGKGLPMVLEAWPGGRWYRDLGNNTGHLWAHVQSVRPNNLLELHGPLFMSGACLSHVLYRLREESGATFVTFTHRAAGWIPEPFLDGEGIGTGWGSLLDRVRNRAEAKR